MAKIVIVEDDIKAAEAYKRKLESDGYEVAIVGGEEAINLITTEKPDLVILDILMPDVSGMTILKSLRENPDFELLPILILTNVSRTSDMEQAISLGADGYLLKAETDLESLSRRVGSLLEEKRKPD